MLAVLLGDLLILVELNKCSILTSVVYIEHIVPNEGYFTVPVLS